MIKLLIGGSPCTYWSIAQHNGRETTAEGLGWELFKNYVIAKEKFQPDLFLYENNKSADKRIKEQIEHELGAKLMYINSSLLSAQNRHRFYVFNWNIKQPEDKKIYLRNILESKEYYENSEAQNLSMPVGIGYRNRREEDGKLYRRFETHNEEKANAVTTVATDSMVAEPIKDITKISNRLGHNQIYEVKDGKIKIKGKIFSSKLADGNYIIRQFSCVELERLQTLPDNYTQGISSTQRRKAIGNGWTAEVIIHILQGALKNIPRNEEIVVLSMYDGIGTGRYCLDKMGFKNVKYFAYEIDEPAKKIALKNYPDIIQMGDAFQLRNENWNLI